MQFTGTGSDCGTNRDPHTYLKSCVFIEECMTCRAFDGIKGLAGSLFSAHVRSISQSRLDPGLRDNSHNFRGINSHVRVNRERRQADGPRQRGSDETYS